jgi:hypothetical protein
MDFLEGFEVSFNGVLVAILANEWSLSNEQIMSLGKYFIMPSKGVFIFLVDSSEDSFKYSWLT